MTERAASTDVTGLTSALADRYRLDREIGQGGMATVYLAEDVRHRRKVAVKVLHPELSAVLGSERFLKEIELTANLQHPHILPLFDSGRASTSVGGTDGQLYYVMPFVEGETLRARLERERQLPIAEAVRIATEVASALQYAHTRGVVHRDIKPENILLQGGHALVADFGIALAVQQAGAQRMTQTGLSLGTPQYMAPEQAMGDKGVDHRADIYALGAVLYEALAGEPPFTGPSPQAIVARVMTERPRPLAEVRETVPPAIAHAVHTALQKLPADRYGSAAELAAALASTDTVPHIRTTTGSAPIASVHGWRRAALALAVLSGVLGVALGAALLRRPARAAPQVITFDATLPDTLQPRFSVVTPDGSAVMIVSQAGDVYRYATASMQLMPLSLPGVRRATLPFVSPDGRWLGFVDGPSIKAVGIDGRALRTIVEGSSGTDIVSAITWGADDFIYVLRSSSNGLTWLERVPASGGSPERLLEPSDSVGFAGELIDVPDRHALLLLRVQRGAGATRRPMLLDRQTRAVRVGPSMRATEYTVFVGYTPSKHLLVWEIDGVSAIPFDLDRLEVAGAAEMVVPGMPFTLTAAGPHQSRVDFATDVPHTVSRGGGKRPLGTGTWGDRYYLGAAVAPDGRSLLLNAYDVRSNRTRLYRYPLPAGPLSPLSSEAQGSQGARWSPDATRIAHCERPRRDTIGALRVRPADDAAGAGTLIPVPGGCAVAAWLPDGERLVVESPERGLMLLALARPDSTVVLVDARAAPQSPAVAPDGRWVAYSADESGRREVFVRPLVGAGTGQQVSVAGGVNPRWARSGRELFYANRDSIWSVAIGAGARLEAGVARAVTGMGHTGLSQFDVFPGDTAFVVLAPEATQHARVTVTLNFAESLRAGGTR